MNQTYVITTNSNHPLLYSDEYNQQEFIEYYTNIFQQLIDSNDQQFACPPELTDQQRHLLHNLAEDMHLKHKTIGNYRKKVLHVFKNELSTQIQRNSQAIALQLQSNTNVIQRMNQNVLDVVANSGPTTSSATLAASQPTSNLPKRRGRPPKNQISSQPITTEIATTQENNKVHTYNLRRRNI